jgi:hypothetical protein
MRRLVCSALLSLAATVAPCPVAGQSTSAERLATARAQLRAMKLDSAALLLREAVDTIGRPSRDEQVEAWLLLAWFNSIRVTTPEPRPIFAKPSLSSRGLMRRGSPAMTQPCSFYSKRSAGRYPPSVTPNRRRSLLVN